MVGVEGQTVPRCCGRWTRAATCLPCAGDSCWEAGNGGPGQQTEFPILEQTLYGFLPNFYTIKNPHFCIIQPSILWFYTISPLKCLAIFKYWFLQMNVPL